MISNSLAWAQEKNPSEKKGHSGLKGLVIDKTISPPGRRFYKAFTSAWRERGKDLQVNLLVREQPNALRGSQIHIIWNRKPLYATVLSPARSAIGEKASSAVNVVSEQLQKAELARIFDHNPDIASSDEF